MTAMRPAVFGEAFKPLAIRSRFDTSVPATTHVQHGAGLVLGQLARFVRSVASLLLGTAMLSGMAMLMCFFPLPRIAAASNLPNVVVIYGDDVGFGDVGVNGATLIPTPNIDRLASQGLNFSDAHSSSSTCTPSRFSLLTGVHAFRHKIRILPPNARLVVPTDSPTLATIFKQAGYTTGIVGKWHLGLGTEGEPVDWNGDVKPGPLELGFDESFLIPSTNDRVPCVFLKNHRVAGLSEDDPLFVSRTLGDVQRDGSTQYPDGMTNRDAMTYYQSSNGHKNSVINGIGRIGYMSGGESALWNDETIADVLVKEANDFIARQKSEPFFLFYSSQDIHVPRTPNRRFKGKSQLGYRGDAMVQLDWAVGAIMDTLQRHGIADDTMVIFTSDNGPTYDNGYLDGTTVVGTEKEKDRGHDASGPWRGGKNTIFEGGTRVPMIIRWPERIGPGTTSDALVSQIDLIASFSHLLGVKLDAGEARDSQDVLSALLGESSTGREDMIEECRGLALRSGQWKYVESRREKLGGSKPTEVPEALFDLDQDPTERTNLASKYPDKTLQLKDKLQSMKAN
tara:strand:+ start:84558 stop:86255 length:1698 start_codon:yes stop_codon:yes gene_type:complete